MKVGGWRHFWGVLFRRKNKKKVFGGRSKGSATLWLLTGGSALAHCDLCVGLGGPWCVWSSMWVLWRPLLLRLDKSSEKTVLLDDLASLAQRIDSLSLE